jgi:protein TonB
VSEPEADTEPEPIAIVGNVRPPRKVVHVDPVYPPLARAAGVQGTVKLRAVIDPEGRVSNVEVLHSVPLLDRAAIDAVHRWRYQPTLLNGRAVPVIVTVDVEFKLRS